MGLRNHVHKHARWMLLHARHSLRPQDSSNIRKNWHKTQQCHMPKQLNPQQYCCENRHHAISNVRPSLVSLPACCRKLTVCMANRATNNCINNGQQSNRNNFISATNIYYENNICCPRTMSTVPLLQKTCTSVSAALWRSMNQPTVISLWQFWGSRNSVTDYCSLQRCDALLNGQFPTFQGNIVLFSAVSNGWTLWTSNTRIIISNSANLKAHFTPIPTKQFKLPQHQMFSQTAIYKWQLMTYQPFHTKWNGRHLVSQHNTSILRSGKINQTKYICNATIHSWLQNSHTRDTNQVGGLWWMAGCSWECFQKCAN